MPSSLSEPRWPDRVAALCRDLSNCPAAERNPIKGALWLLLHEALTRYLDRQAARGSRLDRVDLEDLAAGKALELLLNVESGKWRVEGRSGSEIAAFLATVARNAWIDWHRRRRREVSMTDLEAVQGRGSGQAGLDPLPGTILDGNAPLDRLAARQYAADLKLCAARLAPRSRWAWFLRVFHDMPTRAIATHPAVQLKPGHVDVLLQRCRKILRDCMEQRGHDTDELPPGTFVALWSALRGTEGTAEDGLEEALPGVLNEPF